MLVNMSVCSLTHLHLPFTKLTIWGGDMVVRGMGFVKIVIIRLTFLVGDWGCKQMSIGYLQQLRTVGL